ncbi:hypothetical protein T440DRAFT_405289, partial [Plenodomus tracheiphilus IPT5]
FSSTMTSSRSFDCSPGSVPVKAAISKELFEDMCRYSQVRTRLIGIQDHALFVLPDHYEPPLAIYMAGRSPSPMEGVDTGSGTEKTGNGPASAAQPSVPLLQPKPLRATDDRGSLSPPVPKTPAQTPALSNDVPIGPVSSSGLIKGLKEAQSHAKEGVVKQTRFGTPVEQQGTTSRLIDDVCLRNRWAKSRELVSEWDNGQFQNDGSGDMLYDSEMRDIPGDNDVEDRGLAESWSRPEATVKNRKRGAAAIEDEAEKAEEEKRRRDSAWKSRQGSLAESQWGRSMED